MDKLLNTIRKQIDFNKGKNLFNIDKKNPIEFIADTLSSISDIKNLSRESESVLIDFTTEKSLEEFYRINQYFSMGSDAKVELKEIYAELLTSFKIGSKPTSQILDNHNTSIKCWLTKYNSFAMKLYSGNMHILSPVACSEYSYNLQCDILNLDINKLDEPVLDIGCGESATFIKHLRQKGVDAYGIDRYKYELDYIIESDWLEFDYSSKSWGTIISHLGFSNHFNHHNVRNDGDYLNYANIYMKILNSLKIGGSFYYTPGLKFIESFLDIDKFSIDVFVNNSYGVTSTRIIRNK